MKKPSRKEIVVNALLRGKEQKKDYLLTPLEKAPNTICGTVAVIFQENKFLISIQEIEYPGEIAFLERGWDVDELYTVPTLDMAEELLKSRLNISLEELGPAKGSKRF
ncbi:hypothetical protein [Hymenobacter cellulosivorans]|uniref:Uncharacterized protein n=1 Tax=Hymenobacter cellulosivorans TaxID=2932249 RepID=A0ABY4F6V5_9BACT|nr:hypothetical protein [Hymenobacter cellulosivorans]UOQ51737.1 hypothetical protein MUN80_18470 [Hymenobacter cellulosivorans]